MPAERARSLRILRLIAYFGRLTLMSRTSFVDLIVDQSTLLAVQSTPTIRPPEVSLLRVVSACQGIFRLATSNYLVLQC